MHWLPHNNLMEYTNIYNTGVFIICSALFWPTIFLNPQSALFKKVWDWAKETRTRLESDGDIVQKSWHVILCSSIGLGSQCRLCKKGYRFQKMGSEHSLKIVIIQISHTPVNIPYCCYSSRSSFSLSEALNIFDILLFVYWLNVLLSTRCHYHILTFIIWFLSKPSISYKHTVNVLFVYLFFHRSSEETTGTKRNGTAQLSNLLWAWK